MAKDDFEHELPDAAEVDVCPSCMTENYPGADFCRHCAMPLSTLAAMDPFKQIFAQGWIYRKVASGRPSFIMVLGMWLIFGPAVFVAGLVGFGLVFDPYQMGNESPEDVLGGAIWVFLAFALLLVYVGILLRVTRNYMRTRRLESHQCWECGYDLRFLPEPRCPECGSAFDPREWTDSEAQSDDTEDEVEARDEPADAFVASDPSSRQVARFGILQVILAGFGYLILDPERTPELRAAAILLSVLANIVLVISGTALARRPGRDKRTPGFWIAMCLQYVLLFVLTVPVLLDFVFRAG